MSLNKNTVLISKNMKMPIIGLGTWQGANDEIVRAVETAVELGYRHIDTALVYYNENDIGKALKNCIESGKVKREELFITTKLPTYGNRPEEVEYFLKKSLDNLQLSYVDLYLIHFPVGLQNKDEAPFPKDADGQLLLDMSTNHLSLWKAMEKQVDEGRARAIGLSNFNRKQIENILDNCRIQPSNLQVELHLYLQQKELVNFCKLNDIVVCAYAPLGSPAMSDFTKMAGFSVDDIPKLNPLTDPLVMKLAEKYNKTASQILIRFLLQCGVAAIPKSSNPERIKLNFDVFDFHLDDTDYQQLLKVDKGEAGRMFAKGIFKETMSHPEYPFVDESKKDSSVNRYTSNL